MQKKMQFLANSVSLQYDLPLAEVASRLGWRLGTVKSRLHRALEKMRDEQRGRECALQAGKVASR